MRRIASRGLTIGVGCLWAVAGNAAAGEAYPSVQEVFRGDTTVVGETVRYPQSGPANVQAVIVTLRPGEQTGWHRHGVPLFAYVLEGEVVVNYGAHGERTYRAGSGFLEAMDTAHNGRNAGSVPCRILVVFMGAKGLDPTLSASEPER